MLTNHHYEDITADWDKEGLDCCKTTNSGYPTCVDCCYDSWQVELRTVTQTYNKVIEDANQWQNKLTLVIDRRSRYRKWLDEINDTQELAMAICNQLEIIALQSDKIWYNSCKTVDAVETLFCMIRDFFIQLDLIKSQYDDIQNCISNNTDPSLVKGQGILKALDDYKAKLDIVIKLRDAIIQNIVPAIKLVHQIVNEISTRDCNDEFDPCSQTNKPCAGVNVYYGFKTVICEWYNAFKCDVDCIDPGAAGTGSTGTPVSTQAPASTPMNTGANAIQNDCGDENCELLPTFDFPICNNSYKACVQKWLAADGAAYTDLTQKLQEANKQKEALSACKNSLVKAIKAVDPKTRCN